MTYVYVFFRFSDSKRTMVVPKNVVWEFDEKTNLRLEESFWVDISSNELFALQ